MGRFVFGRGRGWNLFVINARRTQKKFIRMARNFEDLVFEGAYRPDADEALAYAAAITHIWSGMLSASHRVRYKKDKTLGGNEWFAEIYIDRTRRNPWTGKLAAFYGPIEHARGGSHAFYERTMKRYGGAVGRKHLRFGLDQIVEGD
jgi:hypothetical protein